MGDLALLLMVIFGFVVIIFAIARDVMAVHNEYYGWIKPSKRLPDFEVWVLIQHLNGHMYIAVYTRQQGIDNTYHGHGKPRWTLLQPFPIVGPGDHIIPSSVCPEWYEILYWRPLPRLGKPYDRIHENILVDGKGK